MTNIKKTSEMLAEFVGEPGHEALVPILGEVQFMEQFNDRLTAFVVKTYAESKRLLDEGHRLMQATHSPERLAEIEDEAERVLADTKRANAQELMKRLFGEDHPLAKAGEDA